MLEVMYAIVEARSYTVEELENVRLKKREMRGGFKDKIFLNMLRNKVIIDV